MHRFGYVIGLDHSRLVHLDSMQPATSAIMMMWHGSNADVAIIKDEMTNFMWTCCANMHNWHNTTQCWCGSGQHWCRTISDDKDKFCVDYSTVFCVINHRWLRHSSAMTLVNVAAERWHSSGPQFNNSILINKYFYIKWW